MATKSKKQAHLVQPVESLPSELVFQILNDLTLYQTLKLACQGHERTND